MRGVAVACRRNTSSDFSSAALPANAGSSQVIQSLRSPVSPSGMRRSDGPNAALTVSNTARAFASGTLPTRCTWRGTRAPLIEVKLVELAVLGGDPAHGAGDRPH